jgi:putative flippase GtrA
MQSEGFAKDSLEHSDALTQLYRRIVQGIRHPPNWHQLARFSIVGASSYVINLATYALFLNGVGIDYRLAALVAFVVSVSNSFWWNRHWTFRAHSQTFRTQIPRFLVIYGVALAINLGVLQLLVAGFDVPKFDAQAIAALCAMPVSFLGNKFWTFRHPAPSRS